MIFLEETIFILSFITQITIGEIPLVPCPKGTYRDETSICRLCADDCKKLFEENDKNSIMVCQNYCIQTTTSTFSRPSDTNSNLGMKIGIPSIQITTSTFSRPSDTNSNLVWQIVIQIAVFIFVIPVIGVIIWIILRHPKKDYGSENAGNRKNLEQSSFLNTSQAGGGNDSSTEQSSFLNTSQGGGGNDSSTD